MSRNTAAYRTTKSPGRWVHLPGDFILCRRDWHSPAAIVSFPERQKRAHFLADRQLRRRNPPQHSGNRRDAAETTGAQRKPPGCSGNPPPGCSGNHRGAAKTTGAQRKPPGRSGNRRGAAGTTGAQRKPAAGASLWSADADFPVKLGGFRQIETEKPRQWGGNSAVRGGRKNGNSAEKLKLYANLHNNSLKILKKAAFPGLKGGFSGV